MALSTGECQDPHMDPETPLDERKQVILRAIVEGYIQSGEPVGSKAAADGTDLGVSSATVRNEMGILEREGYITQPHTSAGRVPTDKAYRYYVDILAPRAAVDPERRREVERSLSGALSELDELLQRASGLLSELTEHMSLALAPSMKEIRLRHIELVPLGGRHLFLVLVAEGARHTERVIELPTDLAPDLLRRAVETANHLVPGQDLAEAAERLERSSGDEAAILRSVASALRGLAGEAGRVFTGGASRVAIWEDPHTAQRVLEVVEGGAVRPLLSDPVPERVDVRIGRELVREDLQDLSLVAAGFELGRAGAGALGVLGPTRMDYPSVISTVALVARSLSRALRRLESS